MITITIGRDDSNRIRLNDPSLLTGNFHAELKIREDGSLSILDRSTNGTFVNGTKTPKNTEFPVYRGNEVVFGNALKLDWSKVPDIVSSPDTFQLISIGRNQDNNIRLGENTSNSRYHAIIRSTRSGKYFIIDTSSNGVFVNGTRIPAGPEFPIHRGDKVRFSDSDFLDWSKVSSPPGEKTDPVRTPTKKILIPAAALLILVLLGFSLFRYNYKGDMYERYKNSVVLIRHEFYYKVTLGDFDEEYAVEGYNNKGQRTTYFSADPPTPSAIYGTGFFVSTDGEFITNRHVAQPWEEDRKDVTADVETWLSYKKGDIAEKYKEAVRQGNTSLADNLRKVYNGYANLGRSDIRVTGVSSFIGIGMNDTYIKSISDFIPATILKVDQEDRVDLSLMQTTSKVLPAKVKTVFDVNNSIADKELKPGTKIFIIGFPEGLDFATTSQGIKNNFQNGQVTRESDNVEISHNIPTTHGASGSPIFDEDGRLAAVNWGGLDKSQGFNFAIVASQVKKLMAGN